MPLTCPWYSGSDQVAGAKGINGALVAALVLEPSHRFDHAALPNRRWSVTQHYGTHAGTAGGG